MTTSNDPLGPNALDFWLGDWDVTWGPGGGTNRITREVGDRVIVERFDAHGPKLGDFHGLSASTREGDDGPWHQVWVDSSGGYIDMLGVEVDGRISFQVTADEEGETITRRMVWLDVTADALRWEWQETRDGGATWKVLWPIDYRRRR